MKSRLLIKSEFCWVSVIKEPDFLNGCEIQITNVQLFFQKSTTVLTKSKLGNLNSKLMGYNDINIKGRKTWKYDFDVGKDNEYSKNIILLVKRKVKLT